MSADKLDAKISKRICQHMNSDHKDALFYYALHYAGIKDCNEIVMTELTASYLELKVDTEFIKINFDHHLNDSEDAHKTLISMLKRAPTALIEK
tara:strand:- start:158 stop:439 length:282 start_codon:yes stop_codon:yes gene_type:complete